MQSKLAKHVFFAQNPRIKAYKNKLWHEEKKRTDNKKLMLWFYLVGVKSDKKIMLKAYEQK